MASEYITDYLTLNVAPTTIFQATNNISFIVAKVLLKNERLEPVKVTIKLNAKEIVKDLVVPVFNQEPVEINSISKLKLKNTDNLEITVVPNSFTGVAGGIIGGFPWITIVDPNAATIIMSYVKTTISN